MPYNGPYSECEVGSQKESLKPKKKVKPMESEHKAWCVCLSVFFAAVVGFSWAIAWAHVHAPIDNHKNDITCPGCGKVYQIVEKP